MGGILLKIPRYDLIDYYLMMKLIGYEVLNVSEEEISKRLRFKVAREKYESFVKQLDRQQIIDYFVYGLEAGVFVNQINGYVYGPHDKLSFGFQDGDFLYTIHRTPRLQGPVFDEALYNSLKKARLKKE